MDIYGYLKENYRFIAKAIEHVNNLTCLFSHHNERVNEMIPHVERKAKNCRSEEDVTSLLEEIKRFRSPLEYSSTFQHIIIVIGISLLAISFLAPDIFLKAIGLEISETAQNWFMNVIKIILGVITTLSFLSIYYRVHIVEYLSDIIFEKDIMIDNFLTKVRFKQNELKNNLQNKFSEFNRENLKITSLYKGSYEKYDIHYAFKLFSYTYTEKGNDEEKTRYGLIVQNSKIRNLLIASNKPEIRDGYEEIKNPGSDDFNSRFSTYSRNIDESLDIFKNTKLLTRFNNMNKDVFKELNFEFNSREDLCISFTSEKDPFYETPKRKHSINDIKNFINEIESHRRLKKFDIMNELYVSLVLMMRKHNGSKK